MSAEAAEQRAAAAAAVEETEEEAAAAFGAAARVAARNGPSALGLVRQTVWFWRHGAARHAARPSPPCAAAWKSARSVDCVPRCRPQRTS